MHSVYILDYKVKTSQGDTKQTLKAIKDTDIDISYKEVSTLNESVKIPYYLFEEKSSESVSAIKKIIKDIVIQIAKTLSDEQKADTVLFVGTSLVDTHLVEAVESTVYDYKKKPYTSAKKSIDSFACEISDELGLHPYTMTISTACTSSMNALLEAKNLIGSGVVKHAIVIGVEVFSQMMSDGFSSMKLLSGSIQKPFDISRDGLVLGEAVAGVLLGSDTSEWSLLGGYSNCNSLNITSVSPQGDEYAEVINRAMELCNVKTDDITAIKAHATSTLTNDLSEINAIKKVFSPDVVFTTLKPYVGHTLGACGVLELAMLISCIDDGFIPKTINHEKSIIDEYVPLLNHKPCEDGTFMLNYFGFGGNNTSVLVKKEIR